MHRLLLLTPDADDYLPLLEARALPELEISVARDADAARPYLADAEIILGQPYLSAALLDAAPRLAWLQSTYAGVDALCRPGLRSDYVLTGVKGVFGTLMSEFVFAHILADARHLFETRAHQLAGQWQPLPYRALADATIGIAGLGSIGRHIAATAAHFGMRVVGLRRTAGEVAHVGRVYTTVERDAFLAECDYLVLVLPRTPGTERLIDAAALACLKPSALLINVGRGSTVVEADLVAALRGGSLRGAVLDVFETEPLPAASPLWSLPNVQVSPHHAAVSFAADIVDLFVDNYTRYRQGEPLRCEVDLSRGY